ARAARWHPGSGAPRRRTASAPLGSPDRRSGMTMRSKSRRQVVCAAVAAGTLTLAACSSSGKGGGSTGDTSAPGVTSNSILLGTTQPLTGPAAPGYSKISAAMTAFFKFANANGGVNGRKITPKVLDDGYNPATT